jgi:hypothetical protein
MTALARASSIYDRTVLSSEREPHKKQDCNCQNSNKYLVMSPTWGSTGPDSDSELSQLRVAVVRSEKLVAEAGDNSETQRKGNVRY